MVFDGYAIRLSFLDSYKKGNIRLTSVSEGGVLRGKQGEAPLVV